MQTLAASLVLLAALAAAPCSGGDAPRQGTMTLKVGEAAELPQGKGTLTLDSVEDSRCPAGATCVWEGDAVAHLTARGGEKPEEAVTLSLRGSDAPVTARGVRLRLTGVEPHPRLGEPVDPKSYRVTLDWISP
jgi:hypothetical protein